MKNDPLREALRSLVRSPVPQAAALVRHLATQIALAGRVEERVSLVRMFAEQVVADQPGLSAALRLQLKYLQFDDRIDRYVADTAALAAEFAATPEQRAGTGSKLPLPVIAAIYGRNGAKQPENSTKKQCYTKLDWMKDNFVFFNNA